MNEQQKAEVMELYRQGYMPKDIGRRLKVCPRKASTYLSQERRDGRLDTIPKNDLDFSNLPTHNKTADNMIYAIIQRDRTIAEGNVKEIAEQLGVSLKTVKFMLSPTYFKRAQGTYNRYPVFLYDLNELEDE